MYRDLEIICCSPSIVKLIYTFFTNPIVGYCIGFLTSVYLIFLQFKKSTAGFRLEHICIATKEIVAKLQDKNDSYTGHLQNKHRFSLGVLIDWCATTFGTNTIAKKQGHFPPVVDLNSDKWHKFELYIRPVVQDINSYSFLGWLPFNKKMNQLKAIVKLCNAVEEVVAELDSIIQIQINKKIKIIEPDDPGFRINEKDNSQYNSEIQSLLLKYKELEISWYNWLKCVNE